MIKKIIINDPVIYVRLKLNLIKDGLRRDFFFNRKAYDNEERGHVVIVDGKVVYKRQAPALSIEYINDHLFLKVSEQTILI